MDKQIKALLKNAKEAIKAKNHEAALEKCKEVLSGDKKNYTALVFSGKCYEELGDAEKTVEMYKRAIEISPDQPLAWQGLGAYYEMAGPSKHQDNLMEVYAKLLGFLSSDDAKVADICSKLSWLQVHANRFDECLNTLDHWSTISKGSFDPSNVTSVLKDKELSSEQAEKMISILHHLATEESSAKNKVFMSHEVALLHQLSRWPELVTAARSMRRVFPDSIVAAEWMLRVFVESDEDVPELDEVLAFVDAEEPDNVWLRASRGKLLARERHWNDALRQLDAAALGAAGDVRVVHELRGRVQLTVHGYGDAERSFRAALRRGSSAELQLLLAEALVRQGAERAAEAEALLLETSDSARRSRLLAEARLRLGQLTEPEAAAAAVEVRAEWLLAAGREEEAVRLLRADGCRSAERLRTLGAALWSVGEIEESAASFLESVKLEPFHPEPFLYLGRYYERGDADPERALRCYQKACRLNPGEPRASAALSDMYRRRGEHDQNVKLLTAVTASRPNAPASRWAWLRLGLHHLQAADHHLAVTCLQTALKFDPTDAVAWECLGDAYRLRGAYTSAVQAYNRAAALAESPLYARLQVADIHQLLGRLEEAEAGYADTLLARPGYVPALKGLGETHLRRAQQLLKRQLYGSARDSCDRAAHLLAKAVLDQSGISCLWKELADVLYLTATLPRRNRWLELPRLLLPTQTESEFGRLEGEQLADVAIRCYSRALKIEDLGGLWHDLAQGYHLRASMCAAEDAEAAKETELLALQCAHKATRLLPADWSVWNTLGVIACDRLARDHRLAQHALIKSLKLQETAMAWTNLACLYLLNGNLDADGMLAHEALKKAQSVDPSYCAAWTGQALVAERSAPKEAIDLFRHAVSLHPHPLAELGYGRWVSCALRDPTAWNTAQYRFNIERMHAVTVACDAMVFYTAGAPDDAAAWNLLGLLTERQGRRYSALAAYEQALQLAEAAPAPDQVAVDAARVNCARLLTAAGRHEEAIEHYRRLSAASFRSQCGLALALHHAGRPEEAFNAYEAALHWLASDDADKSHTMVAIAIMLHGSGDIEAARTQLLRSFQLEPPSERGLLALTALALRCEDQALAQACERELAQRQRRVQRELAADRALLEACLRLARDDAVGAVRALQAGVHQHPQSGRLWRLLAAALLQLRPDATAAAATAAAAAQRVAGPSRDDDDEAADLICQSQLRAGEAEAALRAAQRSVLRRPDSAAAWCDLVAARLGLLNTTAPGRRQSTLLWLRAAVSRLRRGHKLAHPLTNWLSNVGRRVDVLVNEG